MRKFTIIPLKRLAYLTIGKEYDIQSTSHDRAGKILHYIIKDDYGDDYRITVSNFGIHFDKAFAIIDTETSEETDESYFHSLMGLAVDINDRGLFEYYQQKLNEWKGSVLNANVENEGRNGNFA